MTSSAIDASSAQRSRRVGSSHFYTVPVVRELPAHSGEPFGSLRVW